MPLFDHDVELNELIIHDNTVAVRKVRLEINQQTTFYTPLQAILGRIYSAKLHGVGACGVLGKERSVQNLSSLGVPNFRVYEVLQYLLEIY